MIDLLIFKDKNFLNETKKYALDQLKLLEQNGTFQPLEYI